LPVVRIAVLSDIHSAAGAYSAALDAAECEGFDLLVLLGDLLTYGPYPERTLEITNEATVRHDTVLIKGNHDEIYLTAADDRAHLRHSGWIAESIRWTLDALDFDKFAAFDWRQEFVVECLLFAHANPHPFGNWSYLRTEGEFLSALEALCSRGLRYGVFGHSHRCDKYESDGRMAMTVGSVGQPRSRINRAPQWAMITLDRGIVEAKMHTVDFDWRGHCDGIRSTTLSDSTKTWLCEFFL
jgi:predicted phosphodiesterase